MSEVRTPYTDVLFDVRLSIRYHERRQGFFEGLLNMTLFLSLALNSAAAGILLSRMDDEIWATLAMLIVAVMSAACLAYGARDKASRHNDLRRRFVALEAEIRGKEHTDEVADWAEIQRLAIEADELPTKSTVYALSHNEQSRAEDFETDELIKITPTQRFLAHFFNWKEETLEIPESKPSAT